MKTAVLIGLGTITKRYKAGLDASCIYDIVAVSDTNENAISRDHYSEHPFYINYKEMLSAHSPEIAIISTPPGSHYEIAKYCLGHGVSVMLEKPAVLSLAEFDELQALAKENAVHLSTMFHWQGGIELTKLTHSYDLSDIRRIETKIYDPYCEDGKSIIEDRVPLLGAWIDSGVNALSMISRLIPLQKAKILNCESRRCKKTGLPVYAKVQLSVGSAEVYIEIDWTRHRDHKESVIMAADKAIRINHSAQSVDDGSGEICYARTERLDEHYLWIFENFSENAAESRLIHKLLLEVNERL